MKSIRNIAFSALLTIGAFGAITYTSCNKDECKDVTCNNGGTCTDGTCNCPTGYEGDKCDVLTRDKFVGVWTGADICDSDTYTITLSIDKSTNQVNALVSNVAGLGSSISVTGTVSGTNKLTFSAQSAGGGRTLTGTMTFTTSSSMDFEYTLTDSEGSVDNCRGTYAKQ